MKRKLTRRHRNFELDFVCIDLGLRGLRSTTEGTVMHFTVNFPSEHWCSSLEEHIREVLRTLCRVLIPFQHDVGSMHLVAEPF